MLSFKEFLNELAMRTFDNSELSSKFSEQAVSELPKAKEILHNFTSNNLFLLQSNNYFIITTSDKTLVFFQKYSIDNNIIKLGARAKTTKDYPQLFSMLLIELLNIKKPKYIEDDNIHTDSSVKSVEKLLTSSKVDIRVYDSFKKEEYSIKNWMSKHLWKPDTSIRYYASTSTKLSEDVINKCVEYFGNIPDGLKYNMEIN